MKPPGKKVIDHNEQAILFSSFLSKKVQAIISPL
jgi:hypothetical protein